MYITNFVTEIQRIRYEVFKAVSYHAYEGDLDKVFYKIPKEIIPGPNPSMRCCIYKEREIVADRIQMARGGDKDNLNIVEVLPVACEECPFGGYEVTTLCQGCIAHPCHSVCPVDAIYFTKDKKSHIDKSKCINCGKCAQVCPYEAIHNFIRPCERACKAGAISQGSDGLAVIDDEKCVQCGHCIYACPFGAISDKSQIVDVIEAIKENKNVYAIIAPSFVNQFSDITPEQFVEALHILGFKDVLEAAIGADMVAMDEAKELSEKGFLTSSCCPAFVSYIEKNFPTLKDNISHNLSPMARLAKHIVEKDKDAYVVFIGPCVAKKQEIKREEVSKYVKATLTFEEIAAMIDSRCIDFNMVKGKEIPQSSYFGRIFARSGGLHEAVTQALFELDLQDFKYKPLSVQGPEEIKLALIKARAKRLDENFIEGMYCNGGCIGGPISLAGKKDVKNIDRYGKRGYLTITESIQRFDK